MGENTSQRREAGTVLDPISLMLLLLTAVSGFIAFLFLPSLIEILKPKDKGPRRMLRTPLKKIMRHGPYLTSPLKSDSNDKANALRDFEEFLKKSGVKTSRISKDTLRIFKELAVPPDFEIWKNIVVEGALTAGDRCVFHGSIKAKGNVSVGNSVVVMGNLIATGNVDINDEVVVGGLVHSEGSVKLGEKVFIGLSVVANGDVELFENTEVKKNILTHGVIKVLKYPKLDLPSDLEDIG